MTGKRTRSTSRTRTRTASPATDLPTAARPRRRIAFLAILLVLLLGTFFYAGGVTRLTNHFAETNLGKRDMVAARKWLSITKSLSPHNAEAAFLAARIARREGDLRQMSVELDAALGDGLGPERARRERILAQAQSGRLDGIEQEINQWLAEGDPDTSEINEAYANGLAAQSRLDTALRVLQAWHQDYPDDPVPLYRIGRIQEYFDEIDEAKQHYQAAIALSDEYLPPFYSLGRLLLDEKKPKEALALFEHCLTAPNPVAAHVGMASCLIELGEAQRATELLYAVLEKDAEAVRASYRLFGESPERFVAAAELGKLQANAGEFSEAKRLLDLAIAENPRDLAARYSRAVALRGLGHADEAKAEFERVQTIQQALGKVNALRNRIGRDPEDTESRLALGKLLVEYESERSGVFWIRSILVYDPDNVEAHQELADYYESHARESERYARLAREHRQLASSGDRE